MKKVLSGVLITILLTGCSVDQDFFSKGNEKEKDKQEEVNTDVGKEQTPNENETNEKQETDEVELEAKSFNVIEVNGEQNVISNPENVLALVNKQYSLPGDYIPEDLTRPNIAFSFGDEDVEKSYVRKEAAEALEKMFAEAKKADIHLFAVSGYRSYQRQEVIMQNSIDTQGEEHAFKYVAQPGTSEHQSGLAMDISAHSVNFSLEEGLESTVEGKWMKENAHTFGFILRYPKDKVNVTQYEFEPWHFRYVGKEIAEIIYEKDWTLEEFFENAKKI